MVTWNEAQQKAIFTKDKNILISASAGAGKTTVLIARLMHLIQEEGVGIDEILAMTFSEAAANEMKKRLAASLHTALLSDPENKYLKKQLAGLQNANISTIHGFCLNIMKEYYYMVDLSKTRLDHPMDEAQAITLKREAMENALEIAYQNPQFTHLVKIFTSRLEHNGSLEEEIRALATLANSKPDPYQYLDACLLEYRQITSLQDLDTKIQLYFFDSYQIQTKLILDLMQYTNAELEEPLIEKEKFLREAIIAIKQFDYEGFRQYILLALQVKLPAESKGVYIKEIADKEKALLKGLFEENCFVDQHNAMQEDIVLFTSITKEYLKTYDLLKRETEVIDFDDMEHYAIAILKADDGFVAKQYQQKFKMIMVDEFQDSNDVQDELVRLISRFNNVFRVGDIKQSIYGFRHALPSIMKGLIKNQKEQDEVIYLSHNYRSSKMIVDFNNELFDRLMNIEGISSSYLESDKVATGVAAQEAYTKPVMLHLINQKAVDEEKRYRASELKSSYLAYQIQTLHDQGYDYKDIVVLVRSNAKMIEIKDALDEVHIPCFYNKRQGFYDSKCVGSVISYLKALVNPHDDLSLVAMLTSDMYQKDVEFLAQVKLKKGEVSFFEYLKEEEFLGEFCRLYEQLAKYKLSELLRVIYDTQNFYMEYANAQEKANLDLLFEMVCTYESQQAISIYGFLAYLEKQKDVEVAEAMPIGANDDVVRIMSIHRSKGLQFKVVLLYSSSTFSSMVNEGVMNFDEHLKISMKYLDQEYLTFYPSITSIAFAQKQLQEYLEEEMRLLYVATTRAQEEMHIIDVGSIGDVPDFTLSEFYKLKGYTGWIRKAFATSTSGLLQYQYIDEMWSTKVNEQQVVSFTMQTYAREHTLIDVVSPSDSEVKAIKPSAFRLDGSDGFERGTNLHKMVEHLPNEAWNYKMMHTVASKHHIALAQRDMDVLVQLNQQDIFQGCLRMETVYHEYPFMIKDESRLMHGFMDFVAVDEDKVVMIDFKSDRGVKESVLVQRYQEQLNLYQQALRHVYSNKEIIVYLYSFELAKFIEIGGQDDNRRN